MSCCFDKEIIQKYADNTIDSLEFIFLKEHINYCEQCRKELDLVMTLENELYKFYDEEPDTGKLDLLITELVDTCMHEVNNRGRLKALLDGSIRTGSSIAKNTLRFVNYLPGRKRMEKKAKKTASAIGSLMVKGIRKRLTELLPDEIYINWG
jgi:hypothetical protein